jgi:hypothetical protein
MPLATHDGLVQVRREHCIGGPRNCALDRRIDGDVGGMYHLGVNIVVPIHPGPDTSNIVLAYYDS